MEYNGKFDADIGKLFKTAVDNNIDILIMTANSDFEGSYGKIVDTLVNLPNLRNNEIKKLCKSHGIKIKKDSLTIEFLTELKEILDWVI